jgi:hypothetical protein
MVRLSGVRQSEARALAQRVAALGPAPALAALTVANCVLYGALVVAPLRLDRHSPSRFFNLARAVGENGAGLARFTLTAGVLLGLYLLAVAIARRGGTGTAVMALAGAAAADLVLLPAHPFYSQDVFHYLAAARVWVVHGANPLVVPPAAFPTDSAVRLSDWSHLPSPYGPLWTYLAALPAWLFRHDEHLAPAVVAYKGLAAVCGLGAAWLAGATAERLRAGTRAVAVVLFAWNPLTVLHLAGDGHNDAAMLLLLAAALYLAARERPVAAGVALMLAGLVKFAALLALPLVLAWLLRSARSHRRKEATLLVAAGLGLAVLAYLPFWEGRRTLETALDEGGYLTTSFHALILPLLAALLTRDAAEWLVVVGTRLVFVVLLLLLARQVRDRASLVDTSAAALLLYLVAAAPWFMAWYALWPLLPAAARPGTRVNALAVALSGGALLLPVATNYLTVMSGQPEQWRWLHAVAVAIVFAPPTLTWLVWRWKRVDAGVKVRMAS